MRILQVYHIYPAIFGGVSRVVYDTARKLHKRGHKVSILTTSSFSSNIKTIEIENDNGVEIYRVPTILKKFTRTSDITLPQLSLIYLAKNIIKNFDVIHFHGYRSLQKIVVCHYARKYHTPYIVQTHGDIPRIMAKRKLKQIYDVLFGYRLLRDAAKVIALSRVEAEQYRRIGVPEEKIAIIPNGIDLSEYANLPPKGAFKKKFSIDDDEKIVLYLGRIHRIKGVDILVKAFANVIKKLDDVRLVVVGPDDGYLGELESLIRALNIEDKVLISGALYGRDKPKSYVDADVYVLPSRYETFPMTVLEAYACGKPVIASMVGGLNDIVVDGVTGFLVKPGDVKQLACSILSLLDDNCRAEEMGLRGKQFVKENFTIEEVADRLQCLYRDVA